MAAAAAGVPVGEAKPEVQFGVPGSSDTGLRQHVDGLGRSALLREQRTQIEYV